MNTIEFYHYDIATNENEFKNLLSQTIKLSPHIISILPSYLKLAKTIVTSEIKLSSCIDYPLGTSDLKTRLSLAEFCIKNGCKVLEVVAPTFFLCNRKYDKFREDIFGLSNLCIKNAVELRYILEYRVFTSELLCKAAQILLTHNVQTLYPSTGYLLDDISDNILASALINQKVPGIQIIINGNIWNQRHFDIVAKNKNIYGCRTNNIYSLEQLVKL